MPATELLGFKSEEANPLIHVWISKLFHFGADKMKLNSKLECRPMPNVMAALPNIGGALCSTPKVCRAVTSPIYLSCEDTAPQICAMVP